METKTVAAPAIHCAHCVNSIQLEVSDLPGVAAVSAELDTKQVTVSWDQPATWDSIKSLMEEMGYPPAS